MDKQRVEMKELVEKGVFNSVLIKKEAVTYLTEAFDESPPIVFTWKPLLFNRKPIKIVKYKEILSVESHKLMNNGSIIQAKVFYSGDEILEEKRLEFKDIYPNLDESLLGKAKGLALTKPYEGFEIHWYQHRDLVTQVMGDQNVGAIDLKIKDPPGIEVNWDLLYYLETEGEIFMERKLTMEELRNSFHWGKLPPRAYPNATKENVFTRFKPLPDGKVVTEKGYEIKSEAILTIIKELKQCVGKNDITRFLSIVNESLKRTDIPIEERRLLCKAVITDKGTTVSDLLSDLDDIKNP